MKKLAIFAATALVMALAAVAYAQVTNTYDVDGSTSPSKPGTKSKPIPVSVKFNYAVGTVSGARPSPIKKYSIRFAGLIVNTNFFPKCSASTLENQGPKGCPKGSSMGKGFIENATGAKDNPNDQSVQCNASVEVFNSGDNKGALYVAGSPNSSDPRTKCAIELAAPIPTRYIRRAGATALEFEVPPSLLHPLPTLNNAVKKVSSTIRKATVKRAGKTRGYYEAQGGCKRGKRAITVVFTPEEGPTATEQHLAKCS
jgi:hypothetical protein